MGRVKSELAWESIEAAKAADEGFVEPDEAVWLRDLDGTGSMHVCTPHCPGAVEYIRADTSPWHSTEER